MIRVDIPHVLQWIIVGIQKRRSMIATCVVKATKGAPIGLLQKVETRPFYKDVYTVNTVTRLQPGKVKVYTINVKMTLKEQMRVALPLNCWGLHLKMNLTQMW